MAQEVIPALAAGCCQIWWACPSAARPPLLDLLDDGERRRHARFVRGQDRALFLVAHALTRILAARHGGGEPRGVRFRPGAAGAKPRLGGAAAGLELSISHSGRRAVVALSRGVALGVDVEEVRRMGEDASLAEAILARSEQRALAILGPAERAWALSRWWTRKEAVLKASGDGLAVSPKLIVVTPPTEPPALAAGAGPRAVHLYDLDAGPGYTGALAAIRIPVALTEHDGSAILEAWDRAGARVGR
ncbi:MAG TPA: 4'-phosphopantetheinyl transferase superfamily protein [Solirubrobacteraceae bacterium]|nr:4'-phosphopantetheinyl transferase superfamily protein [Solirubrobacteraceae bacterium]